MKYKCRNQESNLIVYLGEEKIAGWTVTQSLEKHTVHLRLNLIGQSGIARENTKDCAITLSNTVTDVVPFFIWECVSFYTWEAIIHFDKM